MDSDFLDIRQRLDLQLDTLHANQKTIAAAVEAVNSRVELVQVRMANDGERQKEILDQVRKTNGRVSELERLRSFEDGVRAGSGQSWRVLAAGSALVGSIIGAVVSVVTIAVN